MRSSLLVAPLLIAVLLSTPLPIFAQDESEEPVGWSGAAEGTFVFTGGNSDATSVGFRLELGRDLLGGSLALEGGGIRVSTGIRTRTAVGTVDLFALREETVTSLTAENYHARVRFERALDDALLWYVGGGWDPQPLRRHRQPLRGGCGPQPPVARRGGWLLLPH